MSILGDIGSIAGAAAFFAFCWLYAVLADRMVSRR